MEFDELTGVITEKQFRQIQLVYVFLDSPLSNKFMKVERIDLLTLAAQHIHMSKPVAVLKSVLQLVGVDTDSLSMFRTVSSEAHTPHVQSVLRFAKMIFTIIQSLSYDELELLHRHVPISYKSTTVTNDPSRLSLSIAEDVFRDLYEANIVRPNNVDKLLDILQNIRQDNQDLVTVVEDYLFHRVRGHESQLIQKEEIEIVDLTEPPLGSGSYGYVRKVRYRGKLYAGKFFYQREGLKERIKKEASILSKLKQLQHPNIVRYIGGNTVTTIAEPFLLMELLQTDLYYHLTTNPDLTLLAILRLLHDVSKGLAYLHGEKIIHRNLDARNVLLDENGVAKIAGFGSSCIIDLETKPMTETPGNWLYNAPETKARPGSDRPSYNYKIDIFSFGHLSTIAVTKQHNVDINEGLLKIRRSYQEDLERKLGADHKLVALIKRCLSETPEPRPSANDLQYQLSELCEEETSMQSGDSEDSILEEHFAAVRKAIKEKGKLKHALSHGVMVGPARSGKSSLMSRLADESQMPISDSPSTGVAEKVIQVVGVRKSHSIALSVQDTSWYKLLYNQEAIRLMKLAIITQNITSQPQQPATTQHTDNTMQSEEELTSPVEQSQLIEPLSSTTEQSVAAPFLKEDFTAPYPEGYIRPMEVFKAAIEEKGLELLRQHFENSWSFYLTDTGGQVEFQEVIPLLVSGPSVFFFTFRLDQDLNQRFTIEYHLPEGGRSKPYQSTLTVVEAILQTLASVASMGTFTYKGPQAKYVSLKPKMFIIGTHKDKLDRTATESEIKKIDQQLQQAIMSTSHYDQDIVQFASESQLIYTVNNLSSEDSDFKKIRSGVERVVFHSEFSVHFPTHWLIFSLVLRQEMIKDSIISYEQCFSIAKDCGIKDIEELDHALWFLHTKIGLIRHFPKPGLKQLVIRDPQILFDMVTKLIVNTFTFENTVSKRCSTEFQKKGIFTLDEFLAFQQKSASESLLIPATLLQLLENLQIIAPFQEKGQQKFFIPCVLAHSEECESQPLPQSSDIPPLLITFKCGFCPKGLTGALIVYLITHEPRSKFKWQLQTEQIFRDQVSFLVSPYDIITLHIHPTYLMLSHSRELSTALEPIEDICSRTREFVEKGISNVISTMKLTSDAHHSLSFNCQGVKCIKQNGIHPASEIMRNANADLCSLCCDRSGRKIISHLPDRYHTWFGHVKKHLTKPQADDDDVDICKTKSLDSDQPLYPNSDKKSVIKLYKPKATKLDPKPLRENVKLILLTTTENEKWAIYEKLEPPNLDCFNLPPLDRALYIPGDNTVIGIFADYTVAVLTTEQGKKCERELKKALDSFPNAQSIISVGVGYGKSRETINMGDVMVSDHIEDASQVSMVEPSKKKLKLEQCCGRLPIKRSLLRYFKDKSFQWETDNEFQVAKDGRISQAIVGTIVSCEILMKSMTLRDQYMDLMAHTVGGEMQGASLIDMREWMDDERRPLSVIVVKGVADFGDNQVYDENWEYTAAKAAVDFVHYCLEETKGQGEFL